MAKSAAHAISQEFNYEIPFESPQGIAHSARDSFLLLHLSLTPDCKMTKKELNELLTARTKAWPPSVSFDPPTASHAANWAQEKFETTVDTLEDVGGDIIGDIRAIFQGSANCLSEIDNIRNRTQDRLRGYGERILRETLTPALDWLVGSAIPEKDPNPRMYILRNPHQAYYQDAAPSFLQARTMDEARTRIDFQRNPMTLIHGMGQNGQASTSFNYWADFIKQGEFYKNRRDYSEQLPFFVAWDSSFEDEDINRLVGILVVVGLGAAALAITAHMREMQIRATEVGGFAKDFGFNYSDASVFTATHSFGSFVYASGEDARVSGPIASDKSTWWNFQGAFPSNGLDANGLFEDAGAFYADTSNNANTLIFSSVTDAVLAGPYVAATGNQSIGQLGATGSRPFEQIDVTAQAGETHGPDELISGQGGGYFEKIGATLRSLPSPHPSNT